jgi:hypothetical protein
MITDYYAYSKTVKKRAKETTTEQDTPQDKERVKITPTIQENQDKEQHRRTTRQTIGNQFQRSMNGTYQEDPIEGYDDNGNVVLKCYDDDEACCFCFREALQHRFTSPEVCMWQNG